MKANREVTRPPWYDNPLVQMTCRHCGKRSGWCDSEAILIAWEIMHDCMEKR